MKFKTKNLSNSKEIKREFLRALFDDEGNIIPRGNKAIIRLYSINKNGLRQIQKILDLNLENKLESGFGLKRKQEKLNKFA